jgi:hypothetical protein
VSKRSPGGESHGTFGEMVRSIANTASDESDANSQTSPQTQTSDQGNASNPAAPTGRPILPPNRGQAFAAAAPSAPVLSPKVKQLTAKLALPAFSTIAPTSPINPAAPNAAAPDDKSEAGSDEKPYRGRTSAAAPVKTPQFAGDLPLAPVVVPVANRIPLAFLPAGIRFDSGSGDRTVESGHTGQGGAAKPATADPVEQQALTIDTALEVRIRLNAEPAVAIPEAIAPVPNPQPKSEPKGETAPLIRPSPEPRKTQSATEPASQPGPTVNRDDSPKPQRKLYPDVNDGLSPAKPASHDIPAAPAVPEAGRAADPVTTFLQDGVAKRPESAPAAAPEKQETPVANPSKSELLAERADATQPLRTVSLEFTPDGSNDVRLRLTEHSGEVRISLHSSDPSLSGRLHEGIHDLVGSLSTAGYDAEAWTPGQSRQQQRQPEDSPKRKRTDSSGSGADDFSGILQQPVQEVL